MPALAKRSRRSVAVAVALVLLVGACGSRPSAPPVTFGPDVALADFWVNPASLPLAADATSISGFIRERECANGASPDGRLEGPRIEYGAESITVTFGVRKLGGDCPSNPSYSITIFLAEKVGTRKILDGGSTPARDATVEPVPGG